MAPTYLNNTYDRVVVLLSDIRSTFQLPQWNAIYLFIQRFVFSEPRCTIYQWSLGHSMWNYRNFDLFDNNHRSLNTSSYDVIFHRTHNFCLVWFGLFVYDVCTSTQSPSSSMKACGQTTATHSDDNKNGWQKGNIIWYCQWHRISTAYIVISDEKTNVATNWTEKKGDKTK